MPTRDGFPAGAPPSDRAALFSALALLVVAALSAPRSCNGGLEVYLVAGIVCAQAPWLILLVPRYRRAQGSRWLRVAVCMIAIAAIWCVLFFVFSFRLMCRLF
jgi:hypothetical protein